MNRRRIHIGSLKIQIPRGSATHARAIAGGLGKEILHGIAELTVGKSGVKKIDEISGGKISAAGDVIAPGVQSKISGLVMQEFRKKFE